jgi:hypothetical protein
LKFYFTILSKTDSLYLPLTFFSHLKGFTFSDCFNNFPHPNLIFLKI